MLKVVHKKTFDEIIQEAAWEMRKSGNSRRIP
jgi:hypothetical protein